MSILQSLKSQILKDVPVKKPHSQDNKNDPLASLMANSVNTGTPSVLSTGGILQPQPVVVQAEVDPQFYATLSSAMNKVSTPGLQEFLLTMEGLASDIPQPKLFQVALNVIGKKGITSSQVRDELAKRLVALENENSQLLGAAERQYNIDVGGKEKETVSIDQETTNIEQQLAALEEKKKQLQGSKTKLQEEISVKQQNIERKKAGLAAAYGKLKKETAEWQAKVSN